MVGFSRRQLRDRKGRVLGGSFPNRSECDGSSELKVQAVGYKRRRRWELGILIAGGQLCLCGPPSFILPTAPLRMPPWVSLSPVTSEKGRGKAKRISLLRQVMRGAWRLAGRTIT